MVKELAGRLAALDPDAGAAVRVIAYFDRLTDSHAGLETIVRGAAVLSGCPARLVDVDRRVQLRVQPDGRREDDAAPLDPGWLNASVVGDGPGALWLERPGPAGAVDAMVLERAAAAARSVLDRTRGRASLLANDPAFIETVFDPRASDHARLHAANRLGLQPSSHARAVALAGGKAGFEPATGSTGPQPGTGPLPSTSPKPDTGPQPGTGPSSGTGPRQGFGPQSGTGIGAGRAGIGPAVPVLDLPASWTAAQVAFRFTADGTESDPGPRVIRFDELGGLAVLAAAVGPDTEPIPDVRALDRAGSAAPWVLASLEAVAAGVSLRAAATALTVHHSTLQDRLVHAEQLLGWSVHDPQGRLRLQLALALRRLHRSYRQ